MEEDLPDIVVDDYERLEVPALPKHAVYGPLLGTGLIERFNVYARKRLRKTGNPNTGTCTSYEASKNERRLHPAGQQRQQQGDLLVMFDLQIGQRLTGHDGIVHGGIISLLMDECCGWGYEACQRYRREKSYTNTETLGERSEDGASSDFSSAPAVTANLIVNFRQPLRAGVRCVMRIYHDKTEGRKISLRARLESCGDDDHNVSGSTALYADGTCIYIALRSRL